jgi:glycosyltransferase involved in cell wall biosynthesis
LTVEDIENVLNLADFELIRTWSEFLWPLSTPLIAPFFNQFLVKFRPIKILALTNFVLARKRPSHIQPRAVKASQEQGISEPSISIIIPARNEAGNISQIFTRTPRMGRKTELVFVEGHSKDDTYAVVEREVAAHPEWKCQLIRQTGIGKGDAVRLGFEKACGEIMMIMDADLTVPPGDLARFYEALRSGKGEFINDVRLVYPMEDQAMRFLNLVGNKFFNLTFSWLLGQPIKDTLCGTKALWKYDYDRIAANRKYFGDFDPFGDYDLLFDAAKLGLIIVYLPIRYRERTYGQTNIQRWKHGWLLLRMEFYAAWRIKFV